MLFNDCPICNHMLVATLTNRTIYCNNCQKYTVFLTIMSDGSRIIDQDLFGEEDISIINYNKNGKPVCKIRKGQIRLEFDHAIPMDYKSLKKFLTFI